MYIFSFFVNLLKNAIFYFCICAGLRKSPGVTFVEVLAGCSTNKRIAYYLTVCVYEVSSN